jgi:hypothetical protein
VRQLSVLRFIKLFIGEKCLVRSACTDLSHPHVDGAEVGGCERTDSADEHRK